MLTVGSGCAPVPPVSKVGLIAPFEGLYRETGYTALDAVRQAISDCAPADMDLVPLALDDSAQPFVASRSARKILADPSVVAIIGPYSLDTLEAVAPHMALSEAVWIYPTAVTADGDYADSLDSVGWLTDLTLEIARLASSEGASSVTVGGLPTAWIPEIQSVISNSATEIPVEFAYNDLDFSNPDSSDALVWMGQPHLAARAADMLHRVHPDAAFWMGPEGGDPVFTAHSGSTGARYWVSWVTPQYNLGAQPAPGALTSQLTYAATCHALEEIYVPSAAELQPLRIQAFRVDEDGYSVPFGEP